MCNSFCFVVCSCFVWLIKAVSRARASRPQTSSNVRAILLLAVPRRLFCFGSLVVSDGMCGYVELFLLDIKIENR